MSIEQNVASALRLSESAAEALSDVIKFNIDVAKAELVRCGISEEIVNDESNNLIASAIICYCQAKMSDDEERFIEAFKYQQDNLRKSYEE